MTTLGGGSGENGLDNLIEIRVSETIELIQLEVADSEDHFALIDRNRPHLSQYGDDTSSKYPTLESVQTRNAEQKPGEYRFGIWLNDADFAGVAKLTEVSPAATEIGYLLGEEFQGKGIMTNVVSKLTEYAIQTLGYQEVIAWVEENNKKSQAVLTRLGFSKYAPKYDRVRTFEGKEYVDNLYSYDGVDVPKLTEFMVDGKVLPVEYKETIMVKDGVECDTYTFTGDDTRDLAIVKVWPGCTTPRQKVRDGDLTVEGYVLGSGRLTIWNSDGQPKLSLQFGDEIKSGAVNVNAGETMQWEAGENGLYFYEYCEPPYQDGRYENLD